MKRVFLFCKGAPGNDWLTEGTAQYDIPDSRTLSATGKTHVLCRTYYNSTPKYPTLRPPSTQWGPSLRSSSMCASRTRYPPSSTLRVQCPYRATRRTPPDCSLQSIKPSNHKIKSFFSGIQLKSTTWKLNWKCAMIFKIWIKKRLISSVTSLQFTNSN